MIAFKPKEEPILTQIVKSGLFQFMMVIVLGVGVTWFVIRTDRPQQWIQKINRFASVAPNPQAKTEAGIADDEVDIEAPPPPQGTWAMRAASSTEMAAETAPAPAVQATAQETQGVSAAVSINATVQMLEIENESLNTTLQIARNNNTVLEDDELKMFVIPTMNVASVQKLNGTSLKVAMNNTTRVNFGNSTRVATFGLSLTNVTQDVYSMSYYLQPSDFSAPVGFTLRKGEKIIIASHSLLRQFEFENELHNIPPFTIFKSADYRNQKTTFAIVIELQ